MYLDTSLYRGGKGGTMDSLIDGFNDGLIQ